MKCRIDDLDRTDARVFNFLRYQDLDKLYWVWLMAPDGRTYGVFGGSNRSVEDKEISLDAMDNVLKRVLSFHYAEVKEKWDYVGSSVNTAGEQLKFSSLPFYKSWKEKTKEDAEGCVRCHDAYAAYNQREIDARRFSTEAEFYRWTFSENAGIEFSKDDGVVISSVIRGSAADKAGVSSGDRLVSANGRMVFSEADFRACLSALTHRSCELELVLLRNGELVRKKLSFRKNWKEHDIYWRKSITKTTYGTSPGFPWTFRVKEPQRTKLNIGPDEMAAKPWYGRGKGSSPAYDAGLRGHHIIIAVNGENPDIFGRAMQVYFKLNFKPGQRITLTILDNGKKRKITYKAP
ncbi:MAG: PDZ domain-containing protein [Planctomycetota bacterium]|nr:PDZ domain-containing protein [Planctomycetota bacterium]